MSCFSLYSNANVANDEPIEANAATAKPIISAPARKMGLLQIINLRVFHLVLSRYFKLKRSL
ncbi:hypothetical protein ABN067_23455, partial [Providencia rettgeri]